jgi:hypothetical protein
VVGVAVAHLLWEMRVAVAVLAVIELQILYL